MPQYAHRVDETQAQIVARLRAEGLLVAVTSRAGFGIPDLAVAWPNWPGSLRWVELKSPGGALTNHEQAFFDAWHTHVIVAFTAETILAEMGALRCDSCEA